MLPYIKIFNTEIAMYSVMLVVAVAAALIIFWLLCKHDKVDKKAYEFYSTVGIVSIIAGFLGAMFFDAFYKFLETGKFEGGLTFMGGLLGGVTCFLLFTIFLAPPDTKKQFWTVINKACFSVVAAHSLGRIGCFFAGCCYGIETDSALGIHFTSHYDDSTVYPTQLYEAIFLALLFGAMFIFRKKQPFLIYLFSYSVFRFMLEFMRGDERGAKLFGIISPSQVQSIIMLLVAAALTVYIYYFKRTPFDKSLPRQHKAQ